MFQLSGVSCREAVFPKSCTKYTQKVNDMMYVSQITELYAPSTLISANGLGMRQGRHALDQACITHVRVLVVKILYFKVLYI